jgi:hypothetical protein
MSKRPTFDQKISAIVASDATPTTAAIVVAHLMLSVGANAHQLILGRPLVDGCGAVRPAISKYPVALLAAPRARLQQLFDVARQNEALVTTFPSQALDLWTDEELVADLIRQATQNVDYLGLAICASPQNVRRWTGNLPLFRFE